MDRKLYRDPRNGMLAGVCAGIAEYFGWDPTWVRLGWALFTLCLLYTSPSPRDN